MPAFTQNDWNDIIRRVNSLCANPPGGCVGTTPLPEIAERHIWTVGDIIAIRNKLLEICPANLFTAETTKWTRTVINEIEAAITNGWCGCCEWSGPYSITLPIYEEESAHTINETATWSWPLCHGRKESWKVRKFTPLYSTPLGPPGFRNRYCMITGSNVLTFHREGMSFYCGPDVDSSDTILYNWSETLKDTGYIQGPDAFEFSFGADSHMVATGSNGNCCSGVDLTLMNPTLTVTVGSYAELRALGFNPVGRDLPIVCI